MVKRCPTCSRKKPLTEFYRSRTPPYHHSTECKACKRAYSREYSKRPTVRQAHKQKLRTDPEYAEHIRALGRESYRRHKATRRIYWQSPLGKLVRARYEASPKRQQWLANYYASAKFRIMQRAKIDADPRRFKARWAVNNAIRDGRLIPASSHLCACGCQRQAEQYHHWSYEPQDWLDVIPMRRTCHQQIHLKR